MCVYFINVGLRESPAEQKFTERFAVRALREPDSLLKLWVQLIYGKSLSCSELYRIRRALQMDLENVVRDVD